MTTIDVTPQELAVLERYRQQRAYKAAYNNAVLDCIDAIRKWDEEGCGGAGRIEPTTRALCLYLQQTLLKNEAE